MQDHNEPQRASPAAAGGSELTRLLQALGPVDIRTDAQVVDRGRTARVSAIVSDSRNVRPGALFVAVRGTRSDGHDYLSDAVARGAAALVVERSPDRDPGVPVVRVEDGRYALAQLAAAWHGRPAERLTLVGITGTVGKTSVLAMLESMLAAAGAGAGSVGSLGLRARGETLVETGYTAPDPLSLHAGLSRLAAGGCDVVIVEATSHALVQQRLAGLRFQLGIFTNLVPLEHSDYHRTFRDYVAAKQLFFDHLAECPPVVYNTDDRAVRHLMHHYPIEPVGCGVARTALARIEPESIGPSGTRLTINVRRPVPRLDGDRVEPFRLPLGLRLLGRPNVTNAALAATAALSLGVDPEVIRAVLRHTDAPPRRMQVLHVREFTVLDDTVGHPDSVSAVFEVAERLAPERLHIAFAIRGSRGVRINRHLGKALGIWCERLCPATLVVTRSEDAADERNRVKDREHDAFITALRDSGVRFRDVARLQDAVAAVLARAQPGDLVLFLGAQGMDGAADVARRWLDAEGSRRGRGGWRVEGGERGKRATPPA